MTTSESKLEWTPYKRVLQIAKTPTQSEFMQVAGVTGGGALVIGLVGSLIYAAITVGGILALGLMAAAITLALIMFLP